jgi:hypothetical protein
MSTIINGTSNAITFPDSSVQNTSAIVSGYVPYANLPAGSVLQVVNVITSAMATTTSTSYSTTALSATITPKSVSSKIFILVSMNGIYTSSGSNSSRYDLYKNGSSISYLEDILGYNGATINMASSYQYLDSPATTSATTYAIWWASQTGAQIGMCNYYGANNRTKSSITLLEIAA